ncbi:MAG: hypothetical protein M3Y48_25730 [Actinomycetota bacterium]|nr:hypothetical protein [Actinomycetota bacterium]
MLLIEDAVLAALGVWGLIAAAVHPGAGPAGAPVLVLALTPAHSGVLLGFGVLAALAAVILVGPAGPTGHPPVRGPSTISWPTSCWVATP